MTLLTCPKDGSSMNEVVRDEVLIDVFPQCRGVWLDRGELEKLMAQLYLPDDASVPYERKGPYKRQRPSLQDFFE